MSRSVDFEIRSGTDIALGLPRYFADDEAAVLCLSYERADGSIVSWRPGMPLPHDLLDYVAGGGIVRGWNVMFEWYAWNTLCLAFGFPPLLIAQCVDTMAEAQAMNLPAALGKCAIALGLPEEQQKNKRGKQLIKLLCIPQAEPEVHPAEHYKNKGAHTRAVNAHAKWVANGGRWINDPALMQELYDYCDQDVVTELAIARKVRRLSEYEQRVWAHTQVINQRGVPIDLAAIRNIVKVVEVETHRLNEELARITDNVVTAGSERGALLDWCNARLPSTTKENVDQETGEITTETIPCLPDLQAETVEHALLALLDMPADVRRALQIRAAVSQTSTAKLSAMLAVVADDGTLKNMYVYHGASTGRDASKGGVNLQNLARPSIEDIDLAIEVLSTGDHGYAYLLFGDKVMDAAVACIRGMLAAPEGYEFIDGDFSSVENRMSAWFAEQAEILELFGSGLDEYKVFAAEMYGCEYSQVDKHQRQVAKSAVLGCMFGQGARGLVDYALTYGVVLTQEKAQELVDRYRAKYYRVKALWNACGYAAIDAVNNPNNWITPRAKVNGEWVEFSRIKLMCAKNYLWLKLPSGRVIAWAAPRVEERMAPWGEMRPCVTVMQEDSMTKQWRRDILIGSSIFQSAVQGAARDLLIDAMFAVEEAGYAVLMRTHDELLAMVRAGTGDPDEFGRLMCRPKAWCPDLPLAFEAWRGRRFRK